MGSCESEPMVEAEGINSDLLLSEDLVLSAFLPIAFLSRTGGRHSAAALRVKHLLLDAYGEIASENERERKMSAAIEALDVFYIGVCQKICDSNRHVLSSTLAHVSAP